MSTQPPSSGSSDETVVTPVVPGGDAAPTYGTTSPPYGDPDAGQVPGSPTQRIAYGEPTPEPTHEPAHEPAPEPAHEPTPAPSPYGAPTEALGPRSGGASSYEPLGWATQAPTGDWGGPQHPPAASAPPQGWWTPQTEQAAHPSHPELTVTSPSAVNAFLGTLFSPSFGTSLTATLVPLVYVGAMVVVGITWLVYAVAAFAVSSALGLLVLLVVGPALGLLSLAVVRILLEVCLAVVGRDEGSGRAAGADASSAPRG